MCSRSKTGQNAHTELRRLRAKVAELEAKVALPHDKGKIRASDFRASVSSALPAGWEYDGEWHGKLYDTHGELLSYWELPHGKGTASDPHNGTVRAQHVLSFCLSVCVRLVFIDI